MSDLRNGQDTIVGTKSCTQCSRQLPLEDFPTTARTSSGRSSWCRGCHAERTKRWRDENRAAVEASNAARRVPAYPPRECAVCCEEFTPIRVDQVYCSPVCKRRRRRSRQSTKQ